MADSVVRVTALFLTWTFLSVLILPFVVEPEGAALIYVSGSIPLLVIWWKLSG